MSNEYEDVNEDLSEARGDLSAENNARQLNMRSIIARQREILAQNDPAEGLDGLDDGVPDDDPEGGISPAFMPTDDSIKRAMERLPKESSEPKKYTLKVNGKEVIVTEEELIARAQKVEAADQYLAEAKRQSEVSQVRQEPSVQSTDVPSSDNPSDEDLELARALQVGSEEDAARAIARVRAKGVAPSVNYDELTSRVIDITQFKTDAKWFQETYKDIFQDEKLKTLALQRDDELRRNGDKRPYRERYQEIGEELRKWIGSSPSFEKLKQKKQETLSNIPQASVKSARPVEEEEEDNIPSVIANMAKARGQLRI
jgi:hypothetical protein